MTLWTDMPLAYLDLETTSVNPHEARIVTACVGRVDVERIMFLADPGIEIPAQATAVHGITTDQARNGMPHERVVASLIGEMRSAWAAGYIVAAFNACYDLTVLHTQSGGEFTVDGPVVDPFVIDRALDPYRRGSRKLADVCAHYGVRFDAAHEAASDALAAARLAWKVGRRFPELAVTADELMELQQRWHRARQDSYIDYLLRHGKSADDVNRDWPLQSAA